MNMAQKRKYALVTAAAVFFLLVQPAVILVLASNKAGVGFASTWKQTPLVDFDVVRAITNRGQSYYWVRVDPDTSHESMERIAWEIVDKQYKGQRRIIFFYFKIPVNPTGKYDMPPEEKSDALYLWTLRGGVNFVDIE